MHLMLPVLQTRVWGVRGNVYTRVQGQRPYDLWNLVEPLTFKMWYMHHAWHFIHMAFHVQAIEPISMAGSMSEYPSMRRNTKAELPPTSRIVS